MEWISDRNNPKWNSIILLRIKRLKIISVTIYEKSMRPKTQNPSESMKQDMDFKKGKEKS